MSISDKIRATENEGRRPFSPGRSMICYVAFSAFLCVFAYVYESFSHGVYSDSMIFSFTVPLAYGLIQTVYCLIAGRKRYPLRITVSLHLWSCVCVVLYCLFRGVLEIYGTDSDLIKIYIVLAIVIEIAEKLTLLVKRQ